MTGIETPVSLSAIPKFESQNPSISVNVLVYEKNDLIPVYTSKFLNERTHHINLLLLSDGDKFHYTLIKSLSRLVFGRTKCQSKAYVCSYCLHPFAYEHRLNNHLEYFIRLRSFGAPPHRKISFSRRPRKFRHRCRRLQRS